MNKIARTNKNIPGWSEFDKKTFPRHEHEKLFIYKQL